MESLSDSIYFTQVDSENGLKMNQSWEFEKKIDSTFR